MAAKKPRITLTLEPHQYAALKAISDNGGQPMSSIVAELLEASMPVLEKLAVTFEGIGRYKRIEREAMVKAMDEAHETLVPLAAEVMDRFDEFLVRVEGAVSGSESDSDGGREHAALALSEPGPSPSTNRGVTLTKAHARKASARAASKPI